MDLAVEEKGKSKTKLFYGWWIVASGLVILAISYGIGANVFGIFIKPIIEEFGWSRGATSGAFSAGAISLGLASPFAGKLIDRYGVREVMIPSIIIAASCHILLYFLFSLWYLYAMFIIGTAALAGVGLVPITTLISNWFSEKKGRALGIAMAGIGIGGMIFVPLVSLFVLKFGWRLAYVLLGIFEIIIFIPIVSWIIRERPEDMGLLPDGRILEEKIEQPDYLKAGSSSIPGGPTLETVIRTIRFWLLALTFSLWGLAFMFYVVHLIPFATDMGISPNSAASALGFSLGMSIIGKMFFGYLGDKFSCRYVAMFCCTLLGLVMYLLAGANSVRHLYALGFLFGISYGGISPLMPLLQKECFGLTSFAQIFGGLQLAVTIGTSLGPGVGGYIFDLTGSYNLAFITFGTGMIAAAFTIFFAKVPRLQLV